MNNIEIPPSDVNISRLLWRKHHDLVKQTFETPFIQQLYDGSIKESRLAEYYNQDKYFQHIVRPYRQFIKEQVDKESEFHPAQGMVILEQHMQSADSLGIVPSQATIDYIKYIITHSGSLETAVVSLLPCSKLYKFLTNYLSRKNPSDKCRHWIAEHTYSGYNNNTGRLEYLLNLFQGSDINKLSQIFKESLEHEISFFSQVNKK